MEAGYFEALVYDRRTVQSMDSGCKAELMAAILNRRTLRVTPESGPRVGYDGAKCKKGLETVYGRGYPRL